MILKYLILSLVCVISISSPSYTQTPSETPKSDEKRQAQKELERKALGMLDDVIKESDSFKHAENRIRVKTASAFILWKHDEARARTLFRESISSLIDLLKEPPADDSPEARKLFEGPRQLRAEMLLMLAQRDPRMARELARVSRSSTPQRGAADPSVEDYERQMDLNLAMQIAVEDPKLAAEMARESLAQGFSYQLPGLLSTIREKDPDTAARLASDILSKLRSEKLNASGEARNVAVGLLQTAADSQGAPTGGANKVLTPLLDRMALGELTEMLTTEALRSPSQNAELLSTLQSMMPIIERYAPARAAQIRAKDTNMEKPTAEVVMTAETAPVAAGGDEWTEKYGPVLESGTIEEILAAAPNVPKDARETFYQHAAMKMAAAGDAQGAIRLVTEKIPDSPMREQIFRDLERAAAVVAAEEGKLDEARRLLGSVRTSEERAGLLLEFAGRALEKGDKKLAVQFLDEARGMFMSRAKNMSQLGVQLMVARGYARVDPSKSLAILEPMVDQLNELLAAATVLGAFFTDDIVRDDEIMLGALSMLSGISALQQYSDDINAIARSDFERTRAVVDKFQRDEIRTFVRLVLAQIILAPPTPSHGGVTPTTIPIASSSTGGNAR